jgi:hypothetical protein
LKPALWALKPGTRSNAALVQQEIITIIYDIIMPEAKVIIDCISRNGKTAYRRARNNGGAYTVRGNSIVRTRADGSTDVVRNIPQVRVRVEESKKVIVLK